MEQANLLPAASRLVERQDNVSTPLERSQLGSLPEIHRREPVLPEAPVVRINDRFQVRILGASIVDREHALLTVRIEGAFDAPGSRVTIPPMTVGWMVPAHIVPEG